MISIINAVLFFVSSLFSVGDMYCESAKLKLDLKNKTGIIEYRHLMVPEKDDEEAEKALEELQNATEFSAFYKDWKLVSKKIYKENGQLNAVIHFSYKNEKETLEKLSIFRKDNGTIYALVYMMEKVEYTNAKEVHGDPGDLVEVHWDKNATLLELELSRGKFNNPKLDNTVDLVNYWKE